MPKILAMFTDKNEQIGFILFAGDLDPFEENDWEGDCIFTGAPNDSAVIESTLYDFLQDRKNIEFKAVVSRTEKGYSAEISDSNETLITIELNSEKKGIWIPPETYSLGSIGVCFVPEKSIQ